MDDWKELEIDKINIEPKDFFTRNDIEIEYKRDRTTIPPLWYRSGYGRVTIASHLYSGTKRFRYRLKPLESIRITREMNDIAINYIVNTPGSFPLFSHCDGNLKMTDGRKVEIIGEE